MKKLNNKWTDISANIKLTGFPEKFNNYNGILILTTIVDSKIGEENILIIRDSTDFIYELAKVKPFRMIVKPGIEKTNYGPVFYLLISIENPVLPSKPFAIYDKAYDPNNKEHILFLNNLANQTHWHVFLLNKDNKQIGSYEFENVFDLDLFVPIFVKICAGKETIDFNKAREAYEMKNSLEELYERKIEVFSSE
jgi:hypothetical protein